MKVEFDFRFPKSLSPRCRSIIKKAVLKTIRTLPKQAARKLKKKNCYSLSVSIVNDSQMKKLNRRFRKKNRTTDVLSFPQLEGKQFLTAHPEIGDVIISLPTARRQAKEYGFTLELELARLTIHGVLHLFGYDHERSRKDEKKILSIHVDDSPDSGTGC